jgi:hypothetical protein
MIAVRDIGHYKLIPACIFSSIDADHLMTPFAGEVCNDRTDETRRSSNQYS